MPDPLPLLAVPNVSEGRDRATLEAIEQAFTAGGHARLLDRHSDADHHRAVLTLLGAPGSLAQALAQGAAEVVRSIDLGEAEETDRAHHELHGTGMIEAPRGQHPHVGALDVAPIVYLDSDARGAACAEALVVADRIGAELGVPVFLYGELGGGRTRAELRRGGRVGLAERMRTGEQRPDFGPSTLHPTAGATLVAAREPLVAFNVELAAPARIEDARRIASLIREGGAEGLPGVRAIAVTLTRASGASVAQVSMNVERPLELPLRAVVEAIQRHAQVAAAEIVGLVPRAALRRFPAEVPMPAFDPKRQVIENALG
jgi:glutamate formiminotransferase/glutamate formiminotransferase/formiminotetrahydrofolate cyclodeaminase